MYLLYNTSMILLPEIEKNAMKLEIWIDSMIEIMHLILFSKASNLVVMATNCKKKYSKLDPVITLKVGIFNFLMKLKCDYVLYFVYLVSKFGCYGNKL